MLEVGSGAERLALGSAAPEPARKGLCGTDRSGWCCPWCAGAWQEPQPEEWWGRAAWRPQGQLPLFLKRTENPLCTLV